MPEIFGLPQPLTGNETVTIQQVQNGQIALCTMPLSQLTQILGSSTQWATNLPTTRPDTPGILWDNGGVVSIS
ncbi:hypothetical protein BGLT_02272 [Caballeronia glathei]|uniref:Uncharacterized protein n=1 Tax=Caballeronia glathei TaxID=60547 RepID=A0A069PLU7_9BURK|nr:hypothetical protein [Caballeronia glathei]KDR41585.1 hypothetical protein BG61_16665 [Caballeronia glathei]CDY79491.1 hypothetical protein BGLT_02272 [Caballeronia glathei]